MYINKKQRSADIDYSFPGLYFITICTKDKKCCFGDIQNGEMTLNGWGSIAQDFWIKQAEHFKYLKLYDFIVMPNQYTVLLIF